MEEFNFLINKLILLDSVFFNRINIFSQTILVSINHISKLYYYSLAVQFRLGRCGKNQKFITKNYHKF